MQEFKVTKS
jgi:hypothetical protein